MLLSALASWLHVVGIGAMFATGLLRGQAIRALPRSGPVPRPLAERVLAWDNASGVAVLVAIGSGLWRMFGGLEKGSAFYTGSALFWVKMGLFGAAWALECVPMFTFIAWRRRLAAGGEVDAARVPLIRRLEPLEYAATLAMVFAAALMARGYGQPAPATVAGAVDVARGRAVYAAYCSSCHQADGRGKGGQVAADLSTRLGQLDEVLARSIARGVPGTAMIGFGDRLSEEDRREVLRYLRQAFTPRAP